MIVLCAINFCIMVAFLIFGITKTCPCSKKILKFMWKKIRYNLFLRYSIHNYLKYTVLAATSISSEKGVLVLAMLIIGILLITRFLVKKHSYLKLESYKEKYGTLYANIRTDSIFTLLYLILFMLRRLSFGFLLIAFDGMPLV
jgi:hypothetical protein